MLCAAYSPGRDKRADAKQGEEQAERGHGGLLLDCGGEGEGDALPKFELLPESFGGEEKSEQTDGDCDVHGEHAAFFIRCARGGAGDDEDQSEDGRDERGGMSVAGRDVTDDRDDDEQEAEQNR